MYYFVIMKKAFGLLYIAKTVNYLGQVTFVKPLKISCHVYPGQLSLPYMPFLNFSKSASNYLLFHRQIGAKMTEPWISYGSTLPCVLPSLWPWPPGRKGALTSFAAFTVTTAILLLASLIYSSCAAPLSTCSTCTCAHCLLLGLSTV